MLSRAICCRVALSVAGFAVCCPVPRQSDDRLEWLRVIRRSTACWFKVDFTSSSGLNSRPRRPWRWSHSRLRRGAVVKVSQWCRSRSRFLAGHGSLFGPLSERRAVALTTMGGTTVHCGSQFSVPLHFRHSNLQIHATHDTVRHLRPPKSLVNVCAVAGLAQSRPDQPLILHHITTTLVAPYEQFGLTVSCCPLCIFISMYWPRKCVAVVCRTNLRSPVLYHFSNRD
jgi:hypothetical protein